MLRSLLRNCPPIVSTLVALLLLPAAFIAPRSASALAPDRELTQALHRIWQAGQGLPDPTIYCVRQLDDGYLWLGSQTGLARFDGVRFTTIDHLGNIPLANVWVRDILNGPASASAPSSIWIATLGDGVIGTNAGQSFHFTTADGLPSNDVHALCFDRAGALWACTAQGLARRAGTRFQPVDASTALRTHDLRAICQTPDGKLWVGGISSTIASWDGGRFTPVPLTVLPPGTTVHALLADAKGVLWIGTSNGVVHLERGVEKRFTTADGLADNVVHCLALGADGTLWAGTRNGFSRIRSESAGAWSLESYRAADGLSQSTVFSVCEDREGSLWVGTKHGLNQFMDGRTIPFTASEGLPSNDTGPICQDATGTIWVGTLGAGLARFDGKQFRVLTDANGLPSNTIQALASDADALWIGTDKGLSLLRHDRVERVYTPMDGLPAAGIRSLFRDHHGTLWVGTDAGVAILRVRPIGNAPMHFETLPSPAEAHGPIIAFGERPDGEVLAATEAGALYGYVGGQLRELSAASPLLRGVDTLFVDSEGLLWLGTAGGGLRLIQENGAKITRFSVKDGMFDDDIYGITADGEDRLWMACSKGIFSVSRASLKAFAAGAISRVTVNPISPTDAQRTIECRSGVQPIVSRMADGRIWFSTMHGVIVIDPQHLSRATGPAPALIEDVVVNGRRETPSDIVALPPGLKNLEFQYTALSFVVPMRISFRYQLEGFDKDWIDAGSRREAFYTNLPPGKYRFRVQAKNVEGPWSKAAAPVSFTLAPYVWQRPWFWPACILAATVLAFAAYRMRIRAIQGRLRHRAEAILSERSRIARELHDTLLQGFSGVTMEMQALSSRLPATEERGILLDIIRDATNCMKEARRSVAGLRAGETVEESDSVGSAKLSAAIAQAAKQLTETRDFRLKLDLAERTPALPADVEYNLVKIAQEAIANAVKHSGGKSIEVSLRCEGAGVRLTVKDDGRGFDGSINGNGAGGHYGLIGMRERAAQITANLHVDTAEGRGTKITVAVNPAAPS